MTASRVPPVPAVLRLVQRAVLGRWRATGEDLFREVTRLTEAAPHKEILVAGCGDGTTAEWLAMRTGASVSRVDSDEEGIEIAESRARGRGARACDQATRGGGAPAAQLDIGHSAGGARS